MAPEHAVFVKRLGSQESGYSGNTPGQRGKYILVPREAWALFPHLPETTRNSFRALRIMDGAGHWIGVRIVYHNTAFHPNLGLKRDHDEKRIYRNTALDSAFSLDREKIFLLVRIDEDSYVGLSDAESPVFADELSAIAHPLIPPDLSAIQDKCPQVFSALQRRLDMAKFIAVDQPTVINQHALLEEFQKALKESIPTETLGDPLAALQTVYRTQVDFATTVRDIYEGKCAIRKTALLDNTFIGLEAAHIYPRADSMNFLPSNGILMSRDLHHAFDNGYWTADKNLKVEIHPKAGGGELAKFKGVAIAVPARHSVFKPYEGYMAWHRANVYGKFAKGAGLP